MAGAEGFEPSARGFGVAVEVYTLHKASLVSKHLPIYTDSPSAILMGSLHSI